MKNKLDKDIIDLAYSNLLSKAGEVQPELQKLLVKKWNEDREDFLLAVRAATEGKSQESWATKNCKWCYGRGYTGFYVGTENKAMCGCTSKNYVKWLKKFREEFNAKRDENNETSADIKKNTQESRPEDNQEAIADSAA